MTFWKEDAAGLEVDDLHVEVWAAGDHAVGVGAEADPVDLKVSATKKIGLVLFIKSESLFWVVTNRIIKAYNIEKQNILRKKR